MTIQGTCAARVRVRGRLILDDDGAVVVGRSVAWSVALAGEDEDGWNKHVLSNGLLPLPAMIIALVVFLRRDQSSEER